MLTAACPNTPPCPVAATLPDALSLMRSIEVYDRTFSYQLWDAAAARLKKIEDAVVQLKANSVEGLFWQICIARDAAGWWTEYDPEDATEARAQTVRLAAALSSMAAALASESTVTLAKHYGLTSEGLEERAA